MIYVLDPCSIKALLPPYLGIVIISFYPLAQIIREETAAQMFFFFLLL